MHVGLAPVLFAWLGSLFVLAVLPSDGIAQDVCAELDESQCALVARSIDNWNELWGTNVQIRQWQYETDLNADNRSNVVAALTDPKQIWLPVLDTEGNVVGAKSLASMEEEGSLSVGEMYELVDIWTKDIDAFASTADHLISIEWASESTDYFKTHAMVGDEYPYIHISMTQCYLMH